MFPAELRPPPPPAGAPSPRSWRPERAAGRRSDGAGDRKRRRGRGRSAGRSRADRDYFDEWSRPLLPQPHAEFIGEIAEGEKADFLSKATRAVVTTKSLGDPARRPALSSGKRRGGSRRSPPAPLGCTVSRRRRSEAAPRPSSWTTASPPASPCAPRCWCWSRPARRCAS